METKELNIAEILRDKPGGTSLYSSVCGKAGLIGTSGVYTYFEGLNGYNGTVGKGAKICEDGEPVLFPSAEMRDWEKFQWKPGDVLRSDDATFVFFDGWANDTYDRFNTTYSMEYTSSKNTYYEDRIFNTADFVKATDSERKMFIGFLEAEYHGKYNPETGEIVPCKPEPKFNPFDKVLVRGTEHGKWQANLFSHLNDDEHEASYVCIDGVDYPYCVPYEGNEELLGTNKTER